jgi:hypothetical protein
LVSGPFLPPFSGFSLDTMTTLFGRLSIMTHNSSLVTALLLMPMSKFYLL